MATLTINSKLRLNSGYEIPVLGFGVYQTPASECEEVVTHSFKVGYRHVDSAAAYKNEGPCSIAIKKASPSIPRSAIFFTSKIPPKSLSYENTKKQISQSLSETGLDYIDLILIHAPYGGSANRKGAWRALVEAQAAGHVRSIGVSNYGVQHLDELEQRTAELEKEGKGKGSKIDVGQWEIHPWCPREDIIAWCKQRGIVVQAYSPITRGKKFDEEVLKPIVKRAGKSEAQVLIRWSLQMGLVPLPKSVTLKRIEENADVYDFELTDEEMKSLQTGQYAPVAWDPTVSKLED